MINHLMVLYLFSLFTHGALSFPFLTCVCVTVCLREREGERCLITLLSATNTERYGDKGAWHMLWAPGIKFLY